MKPRFLLDEHVNRAIQRQLRRLDSQIEVLTIGDPEAPPTGTLDPGILVWLESHGYLLVTANRTLCLDTSRRIWRWGTTSQASLGSALVQVWAASLRSCI